MSAELEAQRANLITRIGTLLDDFALFMTDDPDPEPFSTAHLAGRAAAVLHLVREYFDAEDVASLPSGRHARSVT